MSFGSCKQNSTNAKKNVSPNTHDTLQIISSNKKYALILDFPNDNSIKLISSHKDSIDLVYFDKTYLSGMNLKNTDSCESFVEYYPNFRYRVIGTLKKGKRHGQIFHFNDITQRLSHIYNYENGELIGPFTSFYPSGKIKVIGQFNKNGKSGDWKCFDENGKLIKLNNFDQNHQENIADFPL